MSSWVVDGTPYLKQQWFWYRAGNMTDEAPLDVLVASNPTVVDTSGDDKPDLLVATYTDPANTFRIRVKYMLSGGELGTGASDVAEIITIDNLTSNPLPFNFFQYSDFDIRGTADDDTVQIGPDGLGTNTVRLWDAGGGASETVVTPAPTHFEVGIVPSTLDKFSDGAITTLNDTVGPIVNGNVGWSFQWSTTVAPKGTFVISKDKQIVPEPSSIALLGLAGLAALRRRRQA